MTKIILNPAVQVPEKVAIDNSEKDKLSNFFDKYVSPEEIKVNQTAFYDLGFDPNFSVDGNTFYNKQSLYKEQPGFNFFHFLIKMVYHVIKYFFQTPEEKTFQELIKIEKSWQEVAQAKGMLYLEDTDNINKTFWQSKAPYICDLKEYQFFKLLSKIASVNESVKQAYSNQLLYPVHAFNRPQILDQSKKNILNPKDTSKEIRNGDVARLSKWGFALLDNHTKNYRINHKIFLKKISKDEISDKLKLSVRELRLALRKEDYKEFSEKLEVFKQSWDKYVKSHPLLEELSIVYSQEDFFEEKYQILENLYQEMQAPNAYSKEDFLAIVSKKFAKVSEQEEKCSKKLYETFLSKLPNSDTAKETVEGQRLALFKELAFNS